MAAGEDKRMKAIQTKKNKDRESRLSNGVINKTPKQRDPESFPRAKRERKEEENDPSAAFKDLPFSNIKRAKQHFTRSLKYQDLSPGTLIVGAVAGISDDGVQLDLPFHMTGFVRSYHLSEKDTTLSKSCISSAYQKGDLVVAAVLSDVPVELSLRPSLINAGLSINSLRKNMLISCTLNSKEEFGWSGSLGLDGVKVFLMEPSDGSLKAYKWARLKKNCIVSVGIIDVNIPAMAVTCSIDASTACLGSSEVIDSSTLRAGLLLEGRVDEIVSNNALVTSKDPQAVVVRFCRVLQVVIPSFHITTQLANTSPESSPSKLEVGNKVTVRLLAVSSSTKIIIGSLLENLVQWRRLPSLPAALQPGVCVKSSSVICVDAEYAARLFCNLGGNTLLLDVAKGRSLDDAAAPLDFSVGQTVKEARILQTNLIEGAASAATSSSLLTADFICPQELRVGQEIEGTIKFISSKSVIVKLNDYVDGVLPREHATDLPLSELPSKFAVGARINCRVWSINTHTSTVWLTCKKSLLREEGLLADFDTDCKVGRLVYGVVGRYEEAKPKVPIHFFGNIGTQLPADEFHKHKKQSKLKRGCVVKCRILMVNPILRQVEVTLDLSIDTGNPSQDVLPLISSVTCSMSLLCRKNTSGFTLQQLCEQLEGQISEEALHRLKKKATSTSWTELKLRAAKSLSDLRRWTSPGAVSRLVIPFGEYEGHLIVFAVFPRPEESHQQSDKSKVWLDEDESFAEDVLVATIGFIPVNHLSDRKEESSKLHLKFLRKKSSSMKSLTCVAVLSSSARLLAPSLGALNLNVPIFSAKPSLLQAADEGRFITNLDDLQSFEQCICTGYVSSVKPKHLVVALGSWHIQGMVPISRATDDRVEDLTAVFLPGETLQMKVTSVKDTNSLDYKSYSFVADARSSAVQKFKKDDATSKKVSELLEELYGGEQKIPSSSADIVEGDLYAGVVKKAGPKGVLVYISPDIVVRIKLRELPEGPLDPSFVEGLYPRFLCIPALKITQIISLDPLRIEATIKASAVPTIQFSDIQLKDVLAATVKTITPSGLYLNFEGTNIDAFCPSSEIADDPEDIDLKSSKGRRALKLNRATSLNRYAAGERVASRVIAIDTAAKKIQVTLKTSAFEDDIETLQHRMTVRLQQKLQRLVTKKPKDQESKRESPLVNEETESSIDSDALDGAMTPENFESDFEGVSKASGATAFVETDEVLIDRSKKCVNESLSSNGVLEIVSQCLVEKDSILHELSDDDASSDEKVEKSQSFAEQKVSALQTPSSTPEKLKRPIVDLGSDESEGDELQLREKPATKKREKRNTEAEKRKQELALRAQEEEMAKADGEIVETMEDFERLLLTDADSAAVWIRYMAYYLKLKEFDKARGIAERGVQRVNSREEAERLNLWIAYLNLEASFGTSLTLSKVLSRALQYNDPKKVLFKLTLVYEKQNKVRECLEACKQCVEKYPESKKMWIRYLTCIFQFKSVEAVDITFEGVFSRAMRRLPNRKHIAVVTAVARLEFRQGSVERGRSYFDKLLTDYPKRTDLWSQYLDAVKLAVTRKGLSIEAGREIFERPTTMSFFKPRKMSFFFTRWLEYEKCFGDQSHQSHVQQQARNYIEKI